MRKIFLGAPDRTRTYNPQLRRLISNFLIDNPLYRIWSHYDGGLKNKRNSNTRPKKFVSHAYTVNVSILTSFLRRNLETALSI